MVNSKDLETVLDHVPSALILLDPDRTIVQRNRAARNLTPMLKPGMNIWDAMANFANEEKVDRIMRGERMVLKTDLDLPVLEWVITADRPEDGSLVLMVWEAAFTDENIQERITFIMGASHELRSPLTALLGFVEILELESDTLTPSQAEAVSVIHANARHLQSMLDDVIDLSRDRFGELRLELEQLDVAGIVSGVCDTLRPQIEAKDQTLRLTVERGIEPLIADRHRIRQIIFNLLQNAAKHTPRGTTIEVTTRVIREGVLITVKDDGEGLPFEAGDDAFEPFKRGPHEGDSDIAGSGIGLTITKQVVELHRGSVTVKTAAGEGAEFEVWLPYDREHERRSITRS